MKNNESNREISAKEASTALLCSTLIAIGGGCATKAANAPVGSAPAGTEMGIADQLSQKGLREGFNATSQSFVACVRDIANKALRDTTAQNRSTAVITETYGNVVASGSGSG